MLPCSHESHYRFPRIVGRTVGRAAASVTFPFHSHRSVSPCSTDLAIGRRSLSDGGQRRGRSSLYQRSPLGAAISERGRGGIGRPCAFGATTELRPPHYHPDPESGHGPSPAPRSGIHHLVAAQDGGVSAAAPRPETLGPLHHPSPTFAGRVAFPGGSNLVRKPGSRFRGKKTRL